MPVVLSHDRLAPLVGERFMLHFDAGIVAAELVEARRLEGVNSLPGRSPFALLFKGPGHLAQAQQTVRVVHAALPSVDMFVVPVSVAPDGVSYEAIFN